MKAKLKLKFDMDKVKQFGIEHGEKFVLAGAVLVLGAFIVKAASRETLSEDLSYKTISDRSHAADENIKKQPTPPPAQDVGHFDFAGLVGKDPAAVSPKLEIRPILQEPFPDPIKRVDPTLFPVEELRVAWFRGGVIVQPEGGVGNGIQAPVPASAPGGLIPGRAPARAGFRAGLGAAGRPAPLPAAGGLVPGGAVQGDRPYPADFHPPGPPGTGSAEGHYGTVITGLIPEGAQREEYERRFKNARRGQMVEGAAGAGRPRDHGTVDADFPEYRWCWLERTDLTDGKVKLINFGDTDQIKLEVHSEPEALAQARELAIGPAERNKLELEMKKWAVQIPEVADKDYVSDPWFTWALPPVLLRNWGAEAAHLPKIPLAAPVTIAAPVNGAPAGPAPAGGDVFDANAAAPGGRGPIERRERMLARPGQEAVAAEVPYKLFRFVDLDVEPGHAYQYRVRMLLRNPNFGLEPQVLLKPETASVAYRPTPWSEKSPTVLIPPNTRVLAEAIDRPKRTESKAKIGVFTFDSAQAIELIKDFETELGALVGTTVPDQTVKDVADPVKNLIHDMTGDFRTGSILLDFRGNDEKLPGAGNLTDPAEMLLLDDVDHPENPRLIVVNEAKDLPIVEDWQKTHNAPGTPTGDAEKKPASPTKADPLRGLFPQTTPKNIRRPTGH